jgi:hypothetical protein
VKRTAFFTAAQANNAEVVQVLLEVVGIDVTWRDRKVCFSEMGFLVS